MVYKTVATKCRSYQAQRDVYKAQLQRYKDTIIHLKTRYVDHSKDLDKDNIIILRKDTTSANDRYHDLLYYVVRRQGRKRYVKLRWFG